MHGITLDYDAKRNELLASFPYDFMLVSAIKTVPGRRWRPADKVWVLPANSVTVRCLRELGCRFTNTPAVDAWMKDQVAASKQLTSLAVRALEPLSEVDEAEYVRVPYQHQLEALRFMHMRDENGTPHAAILYEMGLGKTKIAVDFCRLQKLERVLVVVPKTIAMVWEDEVAKDDPDAETVDLATCASNKARVAMLEEAFESDASAVYVIVNHDAFRSGPLVNAMCQVPWDAMFVDESSFIKTHTAQRTKGIVKVGHTVAERRYIMTGTFVTNSWIDAFSQLYFLDPAIIGINSLTAFKATYVVYGGWENRQIVGYRNTEHLEKKLDQVSVRRRLAECITLPDKVYEVHAVELDKAAKKVYNKMARDLVVQLEGMRRVEEVVGFDDDNKPIVKSKTVDATGRVIESASILSKLLALSQITSGFVSEVVPHESGDRTKSRIMPLDGDPPKLKALVDLIESLPDGEQVLIACRFRWDVAMLSKVLAPYGSVGVIMGGTPNDERRRVVKGVGDGSIRFVIGTPKTFGFGLTLTSIRHAVYYSHDYSLETRYQSEARIHRIGQKRTVVYHDLICKHTIDEVMLACVRSKKNLLDHVMAGGRVAIAEVD